MAFSFNHNRAEGSRIDLPLIEASKFVESPVLGLEGGRARLELKRDTSIISGEILAQTLSRAAKALTDFRGVERNLLAKEFFQSIEYTKDSIQINLFYPDSARVGAVERSVINPLAARISLFNNALFPSLTAINLRVICSTKTFSMLL